MSRGVRPRIDLELYPALDDLAKSVKRNKLGTVIAQAAESWLTLSKMEVAEDRYTPHEPEITSPVPDDLQQEAPVQQQADDIAQGLEQNDAQALAATFLLSPE